MTFASRAFRCLPSVPCTLSGSSTVPLGAARLGHHCLGAALPGFQGHGLIFFTPSPYPETFMAWPLIPPQVPSPRSELGSGDGGPCATARGSGLELAAGHTMFWPVCARPPGPGDSLTQHVCQVSAHILLGVCSPLAHHLPYHGELCVSGIASSFSDAVTMHKPFPILFLTPLRDLDPLA